MKTNKILVLVHDLAEDLELWYPIYRVREEGYLVHMASEKGVCFLKGNTVYLIVQMFHGMI